MQLSDMKSHPVIKWLSYFGFGLIIISFVFFYGWDTSTTASYERMNSYGRIESEDWLSFLPWRKWENVQAAEVRNARLQVANRKLSTLDPTMQMILMQEGQRMGLRLEQLLSSDPEALQQAVDLRLMLREAERIGLQVPRQQIVAEIRNQPGMTQEIWNRILQSEGMTENQYLNRMQRNEVARRVQEIKSDEARLTLPELWREFRFTNEKLRLEVLNFPAERYADEVTVTEAEMQAHLDENAEQYRVPDRRDYGYVVLDRAEIRDSLDPTEEELRAFYEESREQFREPEAARVVDFFAPVAEDQPTTAAQLMIEDARAAATAQADADWEAIRDRIRQEHPDYRFYFRDVGEIAPGPETEEVHGADYVETALALEEGAISEPVTSPLGLHVVKRTGTRPEAVPPFEEIETQVRAAYLTSEVDRIFNERRGVMRNQMANYASLEEFAAGHDFDYGTTGMIAVDEMVLPGAADVSRHRAYMNTLKPGVISEVIPLDTKMLGLQILDEQESYVPALDEVRQEIESKLEARRALVRAEEEAKAALTEALEAPDLLALARDRGTTTSLTPALTRRGVSRGAPDSNLQGPLIDFQNQSAAARPGAVGVSAYSPAPGAEPDGYALWRVRDIQSPVREEFLEQRRQFAEGRLRTKENILIEEWLADLRNEVEYEVYGVAVN